MTHNLGVCAAKTSCPMLAKSQSALNADEHIDNLHDRVVQFSQGLDHRLDFPPTEILERDLRKELAIGLKFKCDLDWGSVGMCALISLDDSLNGLPPSHAPGRRIQDKLSVFIENIHVVNDREGEVDVVRGVVRLKTFNQPPNAGICDSLYFCFVSGELLLVDRLEVKDRELNFSGMFDPGIRGGEMPCQMIEGGPQMVDDLFCQYTEAEWNLKLFMILNSLKVQLVLWIGQGGVFAFIEKPGDFSLQITGVLFGPY
jgi:hypothetical protein